MPARAEDSHSGAVREGLTDLDYWRLLEFRTGLRRFLRRSEPLAAVALCRDATLGIQHVSNQSVPAR